ncbi:unnamed protein product, partial [Orchesella dallaii]
ILDNLAPLKRRLVKGMNVPWFSAEIAELCKLRDQTKRKLQTSPNLMNSYVSLRNEVNHKIVRAKNNYFSKFESVNSSTDVWRLADEFRVNNLSSSEPLVEINFDSYVHEYMDSNPDIDVAVPSVTLEEVSKAIRLVKKCSSSDSHIPKTIFKKF